MKNKKRNTELDFLYKDEKTKKQNKKQNQKLNKILILMTNKICLILIMKL